MAGIMTPTEIERMRELAATGMTAAAIGRELKRNSDTVRLWCRKLSIPLFVGTNTSTPPTTKARPKYVVLVEMYEPVYRALEQTAACRSLTPEEMASQIIDAKLHPRERARARV